MSIKVPTLAAFATYNDGANTVQSFTSPSFSPEEGDLIIAFLGAGDASGPFGTLSASTTLINTPMSVMASVETANQDSFMVAAAGVCGPSPGTGTVTVGWGMDATRTVLQVVTIKNARKLTPISDMGVNAAPLPNDFTTLAAAVPTGCKLNSQILVGACVDRADAAGMTVSGGIELAEHASGTGGGGHRRQIVCYQLIGTSLEWANLEDKSAACIAFQVSEARRQKELFFSA